MSETMYANRYATTALVALSSLLVAPAAHAREDVCYQVQEVNVPGYDGQDRPTIWTGVNDDGHVVGSYCIYEDCDPYAISGVIYHPRTGVFEKFHASGYDLMLPGKINDEGDIALQACNVLDEESGDMSCQAMLRDNRGRYMTLAAPDSPEVAATSVNNDGVVGGYWLDAGRGYRGVVWTEENYSIVDAWQGAETYVNEVLDDGSLLGTARLGNASMGFRLDDEGLTYLRFPGHRWLWVEGGNNHGAYVGSEMTMGRKVAYVHRDGKYGHLPVMDAYNSVAYDINDLGVIVGAFDDESRGFIARPEPCLQPSE